MAFTDAYQVRIHQTFGQLDLLNVVHVERVAAEIRANDVREAFIDDVLPSWKACVLDDISFTTIDCVSLADPEDFEVGFAINQTGNGSGLVGPGLVAASIRYNRTRRDVRHGYTRIGGIAEESYTGQQFIAGYITDLTTLGNKMISTWFKRTPDVSTCFLVVVKRVLEPATATHKEYYRLPETSGEYVAYRPASVFISPYVTSQVSRKLRPS